ncbi:MAG: methyltransferase domain-containing protein [Oscillospiraceae bacterium]|nr:methyltransferase domain-containing protein [Oscillospiraceae bacterium]
MSAVLICPVCGGALQAGERTFSCARGHSFDRAREGYVNLLRTSRSGDRLGDDKASARSRQEFLNRGYYAPLRDALTELVRERKGTLLDICCGEGYYTAALGRLEGIEAYGFDLSREMVRLAAKRGGAMYFVANLASIPVAAGSVDTAVHLFAPFHEGEFSRVLRPDGRLFTVVPGARHLLGLKQALYDRPYLNDEQLPETTALRRVSVQKVSGRITLETAEDVEAVFRMTPYYFHTGERDREKLRGVTRLDTEIEFVIGTYKKTR